MIAAANAAETAAVQLAQALAAYTSAYRVAAQAVHAATPGPRGLQDVADLEHAIGPERVAGFTHARLVALGAERVIIAGGLIPTGPEWVAWLTGQIQAHVP